MMPWWIDILAFLPVIVVIIWLFFMRRPSAAGANFLQKQTDFLDHQRTVNQQSLDQQKLYEDMISRQYAETNARSDKALAHSEEAIRLHAAALAQLTAMNETLVRLASRLETGAAGRAD